MDDEIRDARGGAELALGELLAARSCLFALFHKAFGGGPTRGLLDVLTCREALGALAAFTAGDDDVEHLRAFLARRPGLADDGRFLEDARAEYTRAFIGPGHLPAAPWRSPYAGREPALVQRETLVVRQLFRAHGLEPAACHHVPDDHVALLCGFAALRAGYAAGLWRAGERAALRAALEEQCAFDRDYLADWLGEYADGLCRMRTAHLYPQLARGLAAFARLDRDFCANAVAWLDSGGRGPEGRPAPASVLAGELEGFLGRVRALRLPGLEENELVEIAGERA